MERSHSPIKREHLVTTGTMIVVGLLIVAGVNAWLHPTEGNIQATQPPPALDETLYDDVGGREEVTGEITPESGGIYYPPTGVVYPDAQFWNSGDASWQCVEVPSGGTVFGAASVLGESPIVYIDIGSVIVFPICANGSQPPVGFSTDVMPPSILGGVRPGTVVCGK